MSVPPVLTPFSSITSPVELADRRALGEPFTHPSAYDLQIAQLSSQTIVPTELRSALAPKNSEAEAFFLGRFGQNYWSGHVPPLKGAVHFTFPVTPPALNRSGRGG